MTALQKQGLDSKVLEGLSQTQHERLAYIEFRLFFLGDIARSDLMRRFGVAPAAATRDLALYRKLYPENIDFEGTSKVYVIGDRFVPAFRHIPERVLTALSQGYGDGVEPVSGSLIPCELPPQLNRIQVEILAPVTRAIYQHRPVRIRYASHTSGTSEREIVPFAIASDGLRWHVRAFDRKSHEFRDFVFSRMSETAIVTNGVVKNNELPASDIQWNRVVELDIVAHPDKKHPEITQQDYGMSNGVLHLKLRAAIAGYVLRQWHVDCSADHQISDAAFRLWLRNPLALYGVSTAQLAPGYSPPQ